MTKITFGDNPSPDLNYRQVINYVRFSAGTPPQLWKQLIQNFQKFANWKIFLSFTCKITKSKRQNTFAFSLQRILQKDKMPKIVNCINQYLLERWTCSHFFVRFINLKGFRFRCNCGESYLWNVQSSSSHVLITHKSILV